MLILALILSTLLLACSGHSATKSHALQDRPCRVCKGLGRAEDFLSVCKIACNTDWNLQDCKKVCEELKQSPNLEQSCHQIGVCPSQFPANLKPQTEAAPTEPLTTPQPATHQPKTQNELETLRAAVYSLQQELAQCKRDCNPSSCPTCPPCTHKAPVHQPTEAITPPPTDVIPAHYNTPQPVVPQPPVVTPTPKPVEEPKPEPTSQQQPQPQADPTPATSATSTEVSSSGWYYMFFTMLASLAFKWALNTYIIPAYDAHCWTMDDMMAAQWWATFFPQGFDVLGPSIALLWGGLIFGSSFLSFFSLGVLGQIPWSQLTWLGTAPFLCGYCLGLHCWLLYRALQEPQRKPEVLLQHGIIILGSLFSSPFSIGALTLMLLVYELQSFIYRVLFLVNSLAFEITIPFPHIKKGLQGFSFYLLYLLYLCLSTLEDESPDACLLVTALTCLALACLQISQIFQPPKRPVVQAPPQ